MGFVEQAIAAAVHVSQFDQLVVDAIGVERIGSLIAQRQGFVALVFELFPDLLALDQPLADLVLGQVRGERQLMLPAVVFAHLQQEDAHRIVAGVPGIGDVAVLLHGRYELFEVEHSASWTPTLTTGVVCI